MGSSGDRIDLVVLKRAGGPDRSELVRDQGLYCRILGEPLMPVVHAVLDDGYIMEVLEEPDISAFTPQQILEGLEQFVWSRRAVYMHLEPHLSDWRSKLAEFLGARHIPMWVVDEEECLIHGDPTIANLMARERGLVLIDPLPPRGKIPSMRSVDRACVLQSLMGWELIIGGEFRTRYVFPDALAKLDELELRRAMFWLHVKAERILPYVRDEASVEWCQRVSGRMREMLEL